MDKLTLKTIISVLLLCPAVAYLLRNQLYSVTINSTYIVGPAYVKDPTRIPTGRLKYERILAPVTTRARDLGHSKEYRRE